MRHAERLALAAHIGRCRGRHAFDAWSAELPPDVTITPELAIESLRLLESGGWPVIYHHGRPEPLTPSTTPADDDEVTRRTGLRHETAIPIANEAHKKQWRIAAKKFYRKFLPK